MVHQGEGRPRPDAADKASGKALYIQDLSRPGMLYGKIRFSDHAHARIRRIDTSRAEKVPGVRAVLTAANTPEIRIGFLRDNFALKGGKVRQFRDEIAAVAAIDPDAAQEAVDKIEVEYEPLPGVFTIEGALEAGAALVHDVDPDGKPRTSNRLSLHYHHHGGDLEAGRRASVHMVEGTYSASMIQQSPLGTAGCIAEFDAGGNLTIWAKTQIPFLAQRDFNKVLEELGLPGKNARVVVPNLGGSFGTGLDTHAYEHIAILLAHRTGRAVKILYSREEEFKYLSPRQPARVRIRQGCDAGGRLTLREIDVLQDNGAYTSWGATYPTVMILPASSLYRVPNVRFDAEMVYTNNTYCQAMRGYGNPEVTLAIESSLDELAARAGIDAYDFRRINSNQPNETTPLGIKISSCGLEQCLDEAARRIRWKEIRGKKGQAEGAQPGEAARRRSAGFTPAGDRQTRRGVGMASLIHVGGSARIYRSDASGVILKIDDFGNVNVSYGGIEMGQGLHAVLTTVISRSLGVRPDKVQFNQTDTATCPWDVGTHASRGTFMAGNAAVLACKKARERIFAAAREVYPAEVEKNLKAWRRANPGAEPAAFDFRIAGAAGEAALEIEDGELFPREARDVPWLRVELGRFLRAMHFRDKGEMLTVEAFYDPPNDMPDWEKNVWNMSVTYTFGVQAVEVEVDEDTGEVKILKLVAIHDVGKVLDRRTLLGQMTGALAQGIGYAMIEEVKMREGRIENPSFLDYKLPTACEMSFPMEIDFVETDDAYGPLGAKGAGEPGLVPTAPAIANAIEDAVGVRIRDLPITSEKVLAAIRAKRPAG